MKKSIFTLLAIVIAFFTTTVANAQSYTDPVQAYQQCEAFVQQANEEYTSGQFLQAKDSYTSALNCNAYCTGKKFMSDSKLQKKISNCDYAIAHGGVTREQKTQQTLSAIGTVLAVGAAVGCVAAAASDHHDCDHHHDYDYHHDHHFDHHHGDYVEITRYHY